MSAVVSNSFLIPLELVENLFELLKDKEDKAVDEDIHRLLNDFNIKKDKHEECMRLIMDWFNDEEEQSDEANKVPKVAKGKKDSVVVGEPYEQLFGEAGFTEVCLLVSDFDIVGAIEIYRTVDFRLVLRAYALKTELIMAGVITQFQSAGAAFGGMGDGKSGQENVIDARNLKGMITG